MVSFKIEFPKGSTLEKYMIPIKKNIMNMNFLKANQRKKRMYKTMKSNKSSTIVEELTIHEIEDYIRYIARTEMPFEIQSPLEFAMTSSVGFVVESDESFKDGQYESRARAWEILRNEWYSTRMDTTNLYGYLLEINKMNRLISTSDPNVSDLNDDYMRVDDVYEIINYILRKHEDEQSWKPNLNESANKSE